MADGQKARIPNVLSIAGIDPSGGAGLLADVKAISACGAYACGVAAALTAQNTCGVDGVMPVPKEFVRAQLDTLWADVEIDAVKIGMLNDAEVISVVAEALRRYRPKFVVLDPVMVAKSGDRLLERSALETLRSELIPLATVMTPNLPEAAVLLDGAAISSREDMRGAAEALRALMAPDAWVYLKGGHLEAEGAPDCLLGPSEAVWLESPRIQTKNTHGTGCTLSSALAAHLPQSESVPAAARAAKNYVLGAIRGSADLQVGQGCGPTDHFWAVRQTCKQM